MRGALELEGISSVDVVPGDRGFFVAYDDGLVTPEAMLAALEKAGEPAVIQE